MYIHCNLKMRSGKENNFFPVQIERLYAPEGE
jgi:hypothetical protein